MSTISLLIVDDDDRFLSTTRTVMEKQKIAAATAASGAEALRMLSEMMVDVVILDVKMPEMDGIEVLQQIKRQYPMVVVILLTGHASVDSAVTGLKMGAFDYIMKPCDVSLIVQKVRDAGNEKKEREDRVRRDRIDRIIRHPMAVFDRWNKA